MTAPTFGRLDRDAIAVIDLVGRTKDGMPIDVAHDADWENFLICCSIVATAHRGLVSANNMRTAARLMGLDIPPRRWSAFYTRAKHQGHLVDTLQWDECDTTASRNRGKPQRLYEWVAP